MLCHNLTRHKVRDMILLIPLNEAANHLIHHWLTLLHPVRNEDINNWPPHSGLYFPGIQGHY